MKTWENKVNTPTKRKELDIMIEVLKNKIVELEIKKEKLRKSFTEYEARLCLDNYIEIKKIDGAIEVLKELLIVQLQSNS